jgi:hypothetical protein
MIRHAATGGELLTIEQLTYLFLLKMLKLKGVENPLKN